MRIQYTQGTYHSYNKFKCSHVELFPVKILIVWIRLFNLEILDLLVSIPMNTCLLMSLCSVIDA